MEVDYSDYVADSPNLVEVAITNGTMTITDCKVSDWSDWKRISDTQQERSRLILAEPSAGGEQCPDLIEKRQIGGRFEFFYNFYYLNLEFYQNLF